MYLTKTKVLLNLGSTKVSYFGLLCVNKEKITILGIHYIYIINHEVVLSIFFFSGCIQWYVKYNKFIF